MRQTELHLTDMGGVEYALCDVARSGKPLWARAYMVESYKNLGSYRFRVTKSSCAGHD